MGAVLLYKWGLRIALNISKGYFLKKKQTTTQKVPTGKLIERSTVRGSRPGSVSSGHKGDDGGAAGGMGHFPVCCPSEAPITMHTCGSCCR